MKTLNLDELAQVTRTVHLNGEDHAVKEMSVQDFVAATQEARKLEAAGGGGLVENLDASIKHLNRVLPTIPEAVLRALSMRQVAVLVSFVNGALEEEASKAKTEDAPGN
jgi:hypothetical protein